MPYKTYRKCELCSNVIKDLSSHLRLYHGLSTLDRKPYLVKNKLSEDYSPNFNNSINVPLRTVETASATNNVPLSDEIFMNSSRASEYLRWLREFVLLRLYDKRQYIKKRAPEKFIEIIRECLFNVRHGIIPADNLTMSDLQTRYVCKRIDNRDVSNREARLHLCEKKMIDTLIRLLPNIISYLSSFEQ